MQQIKELFTRDIARSIETVVKADDRDHIRQEIEEYVITQEVSKNLSTFFGNYVGKTGQSAVWISGFFGSGKSHLLKILSYILSGQELNGRPVLEIFAEKVEDAFLKGELHRAKPIPSESILFNIDQKATSNSRNERSQLVDVFYKVFYNQLGYLSSNRRVAEFEYYLEFDEKKYTAFKEAFARHSGLTWEHERRKYFRQTVTKPLNEACAEVLGGNPGDFENIINNIGDDSSIEDFAKRVKRYLDTKGNAFRLNFFIDEVGQYIAQDTRMMLRLQTIAESLSTICKGRAWLVVTAQEALDKVLTNANRVESTDFTKIQDRFAKMPLTSVNVDEVIEKRLLEKKTQAETRLREFWHRDKEHILTITRLDHIKGLQFRAYDDEDEFVRKFPFVPFQFGLFQECIRALSYHNAFSGKFASVGERSMLGVFKQVLNEEAEAPLEKLISFDRLYDGLDQVIKSEAKSALTRATQEISDRSPLAIRVLKALFMVKYLKDKFTCTAHNAALLVLDREDVDLARHQKDVQEALRLLEYQSYIQRNGDVYEYLTDTERDIEQDIKNTDLATDEEIGYLQVEIFNSLLGGNKLVCRQNEESYAFTQIIDGKTFGREQALQLHLISPINPLHGEPGEIRRVSSGQSSVLYIRMGDHSELIKELRLYLRTNKYIRRESGNTANPRVKTILESKSQANQQRAQGLRKIIHEAMDACHFYLNGSPLNINKQSGKERIAEAFQHLVENAFPRLNLVANARYEEKDVIKALDQTRDDLFKGEPSGLSQAEEEVFNKIDLIKKTSGERVHLAQIRDLFADKPYGWPQPALLYQLVMLYKRQKLELEADGKPLSDQELKGLILNSKRYGQLWLEPQRAVDPKAVERLKQLYQDLFDVPSPKKELRDLTQDFQNQLQRLRDELSGLLKEESKFPFVRDLKPFAQKIDDVLRLRPQELTGLSTQQADALVDEREFYGRIKEFINGPQGKIYKEALGLLQQPNAYHVKDELADEFERLEALKSHPTPYQGNMIKEAHTDAEKITSRLKGLIEEERRASQQAIEDVQNEIQSSTGFDTLEEHEKQSIMQRFREPERRCKELSYIAGLRELRQKVENQLRETAMNEVQRLLRVRQPSPSGNSGASEPEPHYVRLNQIKASHYTKKTIESPDDLEAYLSALRETLETELNQNRRILL